ncbi:MAG: hypothetical protein KDA61_21715, partial [Planctomycetales bacterium]|nr:hypothetical protein [Planctomycetales bacterium]
VDVAATLANRNDLRLLAAGVAVFCLFDAIAGHGLLRWIVGRERSLPHRLALTLFAMPLALGAVAILTQLLPLGVGYAISLSLIVAVAAASVTPQLTLLLAVVLRSVANSAQRHFEHAAIDSLTSDDKAALTRFDGRLEDAGFTAAGCFVNQPQEDHVMVAWRYPDFPAYLYVARYRSGAGIVDYFSATSATSDGNYFETNNLPDSHAGVAKESAPFYHAIASEDFTDVVDFHRTKVAKWLEATGAQAMDIAPQEIPAAEQFGLAHLAKLRRESGKSSLLGLADPFLGFPMPPLPGRPTDVAAAGLRDHAAEESLATAN